MSVKKDPSGRRSIQAEVEVPGTPEEVWKAIATGPGVSSWFVPTESECREGGTVTSNFGPGMDVKATITAWDPLHRFAAESSGFGPNAPPLATEWTVEAKAGGTCVVRVVHSLFTSEDDWDNQLESIESGWPTWFRILRLYLTHFPGQPCAAFSVTGVVPGPESTAWDGLRAAFAGGGTPPSAGAVDWTSEGGHRNQIVRLDAPTTGTAALLATGMGGSVYLMIGFYLYGDRAAEVVAHDQPLWQAWMAEHCKA